MELGAVEVDVIGRCLSAAADGPFFEDWEFSTLFELSRAEVRWVAENWPNVDRSDQTVKVAIHNSMGNLLAYPHRRDADLRAYVSGGPSEIERVFSVWRAG